MRWFYAGSRINSDLHRWLWRPGAAATSRVGDQEPAELRAMFRNFRS